MKDNSFIPAFHNKLTSFSADFPEIVVKGENKRKGLFFLISAGVLVWKLRDEFDSESEYMTPFPPLLGRPAVKWLGKPATLPKVPGSNPG